MGRGNRKQKKLARQQNNASGKYVPTVSPAANGKTVPDTATRDQSYREKLVRWTVSELDENSGIDGCRWELSSKETKELLTFLDDVSKKTWKECLTETVMSGRKKRPRNHDHTVSEIGKAAQARISQLPEAEERIFRFRLASEVRLWGFRSGDLFRVLWYDPEHSVYPVSKRKT